MDIAEVKVNIFCQRGVLFRNLLSYWGIKFIQLGIRQRKFRYRVLEIVSAILIALNHFIRQIPCDLFLCQLMICNLLMRLVVAVLHLPNMRPCNKLIKQSIILFVRNFCLNCYQSILKVHDCVIKLQRVFWHVCCGPCLYCSFLWFLELSLTDVASCLFVPVFIQLTLYRLKLLKIFLFILRDQFIKFGDVVTGWRQLDAFELVLVQFFLVARIAIPVFFGIDIAFLLVLHFLLLLLIVV